MSADRTGHPEAISSATQYPVGLVFDVTFEAFTARLTILRDNALRFHIADGPYARTETVEIVTTLIRPGLFIVSWVESNGSTVIHVEDFAQELLYSHATLPDGTFLRMQARLHIVSLDTVR